MRRLKIWIVTPELHRHGGTERSLAEQVERWRERFELSVYTMDAHGVDLTNVRVRRIWNPPRPHLLRYIWWLITNRIVRAWDARLIGPPDVVHSTGVNCMDARVISVHIVFAKFWEQVRSRVVRDLVNARRALRTLHRISLWGLVRSLERRLYLGPATLWAVSREEAAELEKRFQRPSGSVRVIPHGVDCSVFSPAERGALRPGARAELGVNGKSVLLLVGNDWHNKGAGTAIRALKYLSDDFHLVLAGRDETASCAQEARRFGVASRVHFWPHAPDVLRYYAAADCLVAPSREDAFALPGLEAMACGLPVIVSAKAGVSELVENGRQALILQDPDDEETLAQLVRGAFETPGLAEQLRREGRALAERCSWDANAERAAALMEREAATPRVLVLAPDPWGTGGIERASRTILRALAELYGPERVGLIAIWGPVPRAEPLGCRVLWAGNGRRGVRLGVGRKIVSTIAAVRAARHWRGRQLVIIACHPHLAPVAWACGVVSGAPTVVWCHGFEVWGSVRRSVAAALSRADLLLAVSRFTADRLLQAANVPAARVIVLPHALPPEVEATDGAPHRSLRVLTVARLEPAHAYKGVDTLLRAWQLVTRAVPRAELVIVGDGADRPRLEALTAPVGGSVRFLGTVPDPELRRLYAESTVF